jgi:uncharacterized protein (DUF1015 family)
VGDLADVIAPPYDVIDQAYAQRLYARSPYNVIRLILNQAADPYADAAGHLAAWWRDRVLLQDATPSLYYYVQDFTLPDRTTHQRRGLIGTLRLERFGEGAVYAHERTFARAKADRLRLIEACRTNLSPLLGVYPNQPAVVAPAEEVRGRQAAWIDVTDDRGERHRVWRLSDPATIAAIVAALRPLNVFIADGHHRYETAVAYRDQRRASGETDADAPHEFVLMYLASMDDPGLVVLPTHRILHRLPTGTPADWPLRLAESFTVDRYPLTAAGEAALWNAIAEVPGAATIGARVAGRDELLRFTVRDRSATAAQLEGVHPAVRSLAVTVLDAMILRQGLGVDPSAAAQAGVLTYTHRVDEALAAVGGGTSAGGLRSAGAAAAFLLRPPSLREVETVCLAGQTMPEKSTYFYPKLLSGLLFHALDEVVAWK